MIKDRYFRGMIPRLHPTLLPEGAAELARDVNLEQGVIQPWACPVESCMLGFEPATIIDSELCCAFEDQFDWVEYRGSGCEYIIRNKDGKLEIATKANACRDVWCPLTPPCPDRSPTAEKDEEESSCDPHPTAYRYTYVNSFGFEGAPSPASSFVMAGDGIASITNIEEPTDECVTHVRIYRLDSGPQTGDGQIEISAEWLRVGEIPAGTTEFNDGSGIYCTGIPLDSWGAFEAPRLTGLAAMSNGALVGFSGRLLHFSDPTGLYPAPHAWSGDHDLELPSTIKAIESKGDVLYVATDDYPYIVSPRIAGGVLVYDYIPLETYAPIAVAESLHKTNTGVAYVSDIGLVLVNGRTASVVTDQYFTDQQWRKANIRNAITARGRTILIGDTSYILHSDSATHNHPNELAPLSELTLLGNPKSMTVDSNGDVIFSTEAGLSKFSMADDGTCCPYTYISRREIHPSGVNYAAAKISSSEAVNFKLERTDCTAIRTVYERDTPCKPFRLPGKQLATEFRYTLTGCGLVSGVHVAETMNELAQ